MRSFGERLCAQLCRQEKMVAVDFEGRRYDTGNLSGFLEATVDFALDHPEKYACVGSFSSPLDCAADLRDRHAGQPGYPRWEDAAGSELDILHTAGHLTEAGAALPRMFQACGTEDFTWQYNLTARERFQSLGCDHTWFEAPGDHHFDFWNLALEKYLDWLPLKEGRATA